MTDRYAMVAELLWPEYLLGSQWPNAGPLVITPRAPRGRVVTGRDFLPHSRSLFSNCVAQAPEAIAHQG